MDKKQASGHRVHFSRIVGTTPVLLVGADTSRWQVVIVNAGSGTVSLGISGSTQLSLPTNGILYDTYSIDDWWASYSTSSGTVSGYYIR